MWVNVRYWWLLRHGYTWHAPGVVSQRTSRDIECARQFQQSSILCRAAVMFWQLVAALRSCWHIVIILSCCSKLVQSTWNWTPGVCLISLPQEAEQQTLGRLLSSTETSNTFFFCNTHVICFDSSFWRSIAPEPSDWCEPWGEVFLVQSSRWRDQRFTHDLSNEPRTEGWCICSKSTRGLVFVHQSTTQRIFNKLGRVSRPMLHATSAICHILPRDLYGPRSEETCFELRQARRCQWAAKRRLAVAEL